MDSLMIQLLSVVITSLFGLSIIFLSNQLRHRSKKKRLPRAGGALPIIGHLHLFGGKQLLHKTLGAMADKYGAAFTIMLGSQENLVVSSWEIAKECFTSLDKVFSDRPHITATRILGYNGAMFGLAPSGPYWRQMRKIATLELLSHRRIDLLSHIRVSELQVSLNELQANGSGVVDMKRWFDDLTLNSMVRMIGGKRSVERRHRDLLKEAMYIFGVFVLSDAIPSLAWLDLQGHKRKMERTAKELDDVVGAWLEDHKERRRASEGEARVDEDFMDTMLTILGEDVDFSQFQTDTITKATCLNLALAGSDTTMVTLTWALSLLLNNPHALRRAQQEVDTYIEKDRHVNDSDVKNLKFLEAVVKETLRLYPAGPIIGLHSSSEDCTLSSGDHVPAATRLLVNIWKIQRDETLWPEPLEFKPERFLTSHKDIDVKGNHFQLLPFGSGRRSCPGISLALQTVQLTLASLLHSFELSRPSEAAIDMTESAGLTNLKATPLQVYVTPRLPPQLMNKIM